MDNIYFMPGCAFELYKPETSLKIMGYLGQHFPGIKRYDTCCRHEMTIPKSSTVIFVCSSCAMRLKNQDDTLTLKSLWSVIHENGDYPLPQYTGLKVSIQDSCTAKAMPSIHQEVRTLLKDMDIDVIENEHHSMNSICCGDSLYGKTDEKTVIDSMKTRAESMPCEEVVTYCVSCMNSVYVGGRTPRLLTDLILGEDTVPPLSKMTHVEWVDKQLEYIQSH
ncbi:MAG: hypothetical protein ACOYIK_06865 [Coriobacteriales bacterium]|jgi:hypothetical protein